MFLYFLTRQLGSCAFVRTYSHSFSCLGSTLWVHSLYLAITSFYSQIFTLMLLYGLVYYPCYHLAFLTRSLLTVSVAFPYFTHTLFTSISLTLLYLVIRQLGVGAGNKIKCAHELLNAIS